MGVISHRMTGTALVLKPTAEGNKDLMPVYATAGSAAFDLHSAIDIVIPPRSWESVPLGVYCAEMDRSHCVFLFCRSGKAASCGIGMRNGVGVIDSDYRGEWHALLDNWSDVPFHVQRGDRVAQGIVIEPHRLHGIEVLQQERTGGLGSTGG